MNEQFIAALPNRSPARRWAQARPRGILDVDAPTRDVLPPFPITIFQMQEHAHALAQAGLGLSTGT